MRQQAATATYQDDTALPVAEGLRRAAGELEAVRDGIENAFEVVHEHADPKSLADPAYLVAMQSIDTLSQQIAAVERFILNLSNACSDNIALESKAASAGITLAAVAARLTSALDSHRQDSGECDFF